MPHGSAFRDPKAITFSAPERELIIHDRIGDSAVPLTRGPRQRTGTFRSENGSRFQVNCTVEGPSADWELAPVEVFYMRVRCIRHIPAWSRSKVLAGGHNSSTSPWRKWNSMWRTAKISRSGPV